jgi:hypothetical protein
MLRSNLCVGVAAGCALGIIAWTRGDSVASKNTAGTPRSPSMAEATRTATHYVDNASDPESGNAAEIDPDRRESSWREWYADIPKAYIEDGILRIEVDPDRTRKPEGVRYEMESQINFYVEIYAVPGPSFHLMMGLPAMGLGRRSPPAKLTQKLPLEYLRKIFKVTEDQMGIVVRFYVGTVDRNNDVKEFVIMSERLFIYKF